MKLMSDRLIARKYETSSSSYRLSVSPLGEKGGKLCLEHDLEPLDVVTIVKPAKKSAERCLVGCMANVRSPVNQYSLCLQDRRVRYCE